MSDNLERSFVSRSLWQINLFDYGGRHFYLEKMTPLLKKLTQANDGDVSISGHNKPLTELIVYKQNLRSIPPTVYEYPTNIAADVGIEWLNRNLNEKEFAGYAAMKLRGHVT